MKDNKDIKTKTCNPERGDAARKKLIEAGLRIFSEVGYGGASTRMLARAAGVNIAAITYYFGSKEGLYLAVIDYIIDNYKKSIGEGLSKIKHALQDPNVTPDEYHAMFDAYIRTLIHFVLQEGKERSHISHIYLREQLDPTSASHRLYEGFTRDMHETLASLVARIVGSDIPTADVKIMTQTLLGQITIFKFSREAILHNMQWTTYGDSRMTDIERIILFHIDIILRAYQKKDKRS